MDDERLPRSLTRSICEEVLEQFSKSDDSLAGLIEANHIEVRDFMMLSLICDQGEMGVDQLASALGLSYEPIIGCIEHLRTAGLIRLAEGTTRMFYAARFESTAAGRLVTRRILGHGER